MKDEILALVGRHCETVRRESMEIADLVPPGAAPTAAVRATLAARIHKLKGSSGTIGFKEISTACREIETVLDEDEGRDPDLEQDVDLGAALARLRDLALTLRPEHSTLYAKMAGLHPCSGRRDSG